MQYLSQISHLRTITVFRGVSGLDKID